jgi:hypothetical protein
MRPISPYLSCAPGILLNTARPGTLRSVDSRGTRSDGLPRWTEKVSGPGSGAVHLIDRSQGAPGLLGYGLFGAV